MKKLIAISFIILTFGIIGPIYAVDQCVDQYTSGKPYIFYNGSNLNCPLSDSGLVNYIEHMVPFPADIQNIEYYATVNLNGATGCIDLRVIVEGDFNNPQDFADVKEGQQIKINIPRSYFDNTNFAGCSSNWFVHTADVAWRFKPCDKEWWQVNDYLSVQVCTLNINTCCPGSNCCTPTAIELSSFTLQSGNGSVTLNWTTETETDNVAFNILRADKKNGDYEQITQIPAQGSATQAASYEYIDTSVERGKKYWYKLQDVDLGGNTEDHGPLKVKIKKVVK